MKKKLYVMPLCEVVTLKSTDLMHVQSPSGEEFPGGPAGAPLRKTPVLGNDSVQVF